MTASSQSKAEKIANELLGIAGVTINGSQPFDIQVHNKRFFDEVLTNGSIGLGESYMQKWWDCAALDQFFFKVLSAHLDEHIKFNMRLLFQVLQRKLFNLQSKRRAFNIGEHHYDMGNDLYKIMLDKRMVYTCGYWKEADNLDDAQEDKLKLTCEKLQLKPGMKVLDIGCGWGSFAKYAAENYGVEVVGITVSQQQVELAREMCQGLPIDLRLQDYRDVNEEFDRIVSLGMFEHVGEKNYSTYMSVAHRCLKENGIFLLHTIGSNTTTHSVDPWINKYIFPDGKIPSILEISKASEEYFVMEDWHNFGPYYDKTLMAWQKNVASEWEILKATYDDTFKRMWDYYLLSCAGSFRARHIQLWQIVFTKGAVEGGVPSVR
ncbi:MAG: cyclopropane fatty acyl phospholipid synthase [Coxiellaceae bacterium]|nr:cyclopropane fatty acyl phospholipid synthase [Coxiellaceae bacterium]